ncbi:GntR family transcriptional regulator [Pseudarthrobacter sp. NPDC080039]|uniref:GntR family transcriptional regulator n=1 Tax=unclassified Pseudarthrobacter TaxID=2647000 RepID=UPI003450F833
MSAPLLISWPERTSKRRALPEEVASYVRELIVSGTVKPGEFLRMEPLAEAVGVSNTPVREGLLLLRSEGFVRLVPRRGFVVAPFTPQDVRDLFWAQAQLGGELAARAAEKITPEGIERLEDLLGSYEAAVRENNRRAIADLGHAYHREINLTADSHRLALLLSSVVKHLPNRFYATIEGQVTACRVEHPMVVEALRAGDASRARSLMEQHIAKGADRLIETLAQRGVWVKDERTLAVVANG